MGKVVNKIKNAEDVKVLCIFIRLKGAKLAKSLHYCLFLSVCSFNKIIKGNAVKFCKLYCRPQR